MAQSEGARSYRVLVVEDEGLIAHDVARRLKSLGHEVLGPASTAEEAVDLASGAEIVLMDIHIDGRRDGIDAALEIRERHHLPVIFLTAHADRTTLERAKEAGPFGYIVKPLGPASLQTSIEIAIVKTWAGTDAGAAGSGVDLDSRFYRRRSRGSRPGGSRTLAEPRGGAIHGVDPSRSRGPAGGQSGASESRAGCK